MKKLILIIMLFFCTLVGCDDYSSNDEGEIYNVHLNIQREGSLGGLFIAYSIYIDGEKLGEISNLQSKDYTIELSEGEHTLNIKYGIIGKKVKFIVNEDNINFRFSCKTKDTIGIDVWENHSVSY